MPGRAHLRRFGKCYRRARRQRDAYADGRSRYAADHRRAEGNRSAHFAPIAEKRNYWDRLAPAPVARKLIFRNPHSKFTFLRPRRSLLTLPSDNQNVLPRKYTGNPVRSKDNLLF